MAVRAWAAVNARMLGEMAMLCTGSSPETVATFDVVVPKEFSGKRFDRVAAMLLADDADVSRTALTRGIRCGQVTLDGRVAKPKTTVSGGERIRARLAQSPRFDWNAAEALPLRILYEDEHLIVVDKPPGLVVHPGAGNARGTLVNGLLHHRPALAELPRAGLIHRLDKDTSGVLAVAADAASQRRLTAAMSERRIERRYLAVAEGRVLADARIDLAIGRDPKNRLRQRVRADGRPAATRIHVRKRFAAHTLIEADLETGRTHQVRVHMAAIGHPLVGDRRYGARGIVSRAAPQAAADVVRRFSRQALHAWRLSFAHPVSGKPLVFVCPPPADLGCLITALEQGQACD